MKKEKQSAVPVAINGISDAEILARKIIKSRGKKPEQAAKELNDYIAKYGGHTGGLLFSVTIRELLNHPEYLMEGATGWQLDMLTERLAVVLWVGCQMAKELPADGINIGWRLCRIATAIEYPSVRTTILSKRGKHAREARGDRVMKKDCIAFAKKSWKEEPKERSKAIAKYLRDTLSPGNYGMKKMPTVETVNRWIKSYAPLEAKKPGRSRKRK